jgi:hypothetical protein
MSGKSACVAISQQAADLQAQAAADNTTIGGVVNNFFNAAAGVVNGITGSNNKTSTTVNNIMNQTITSDEKTSIVSQCTNSLASSQINILSNSKCANCNGGIIYNIDGSIFAIDHTISQIPGGCVVSGNTQSNIGVTTQDCLINSTIAALAKNNSSTQAQALASALQNSSGIGSGSNTQTQNSCTNINNNVSSDQYLSSLSTCGNTLSNSQQNISTNCGTNTNNVQSNNFTAYQKCTQGAGTTSDVTTETKTAAETKSTTTQESSGLGLNQLLATAFSGVDTPIIILGVVIAIVIIAVMYFGVSFLLSPAGQKVSEQVAAAGIQSMNKSGGQFVQPIAGLGVNHLKIKLV